MDNIFFDINRLKHLGHGAIIGKTVRIRKPEEVYIGAHTIIDDFTYISCAAEIGSYCHIAPQVTISGGPGFFKMGDFCGISAGSSIFTCSSDYAWISLDLPSIPIEVQFGGIKSSVELSDHVLLGAHSVVMPGVILPEGFASAAKSIINQGQYDAWTLYDGNCPHQCRSAKRRDVEKLMKAIRILGQT